MLGHWLRPLAMRRLVLQAIAGYDALDINSADVPVADYVSCLRDGTKKLRVGVPRAYFYDDLDDEVRAAVERLWP